VSRIVVAGAGIGGLAAALSLHAAGERDVTLVEAVSELRPLGVGINLLPHAVRELHELGLADELAAIAVEVGEMAYYNQHGSKICGVPRGLAAGTTWPQYSVHRGEFQMMLFRAVLDRLGQDAVRPGNALRGFQQSGGGVVAEIERTADGHRYHEPAGVLVAGDGINSTIRAALYPDEGGPCWDGCIMWRGTSTLDTDFVRRGTVLFAGHHDQRFMAYPIRDARGALIVNWIATVKVDGPRLSPEDWNRKVDPREVLDRYSSWHFDVLDIPELVSAAADVYEYPMTDRDPLPRWSFDRVTLLGDAAHPMYPTGSQGSSQAILDGRTLAAELAGDADARAALRRYDEQRRPQTAKVVLANRKMADAQLLQLVHDRAPHGFADPAEVISPEEIDDITSRYQRMAGFDPRELNSRGSFLAG
jgi:2-polyprenyl-6-methoxyphenol hydroxylase-like FAD-dependent oxidoreductase